MPLSIKYKIRLGTIFLFFLAMLSGGLSIYYLATLRRDSRNILKANYESLQFCHEMQKDLDSISHHHVRYLDSFEKQLILQESNITEAGEQTATRQLRAQFELLKKGDQSELVKWSIDSRLQEVLLLNMIAIKNKNEKTENAAEEAMTFLITAVAFIFIVGLTFTYNFPFIITTPIRKLTDAIREISQKNYNYRVHIESRDEFGQLARSFNEMAERLEYFENSNLNKILFEKSRAEAVINSLKDASIGIDRDNKVLFANSQAMQLLGVKPNDIVGQSVAQFSLRNDLFRYLVEEESSAPFKIVVDGRENYFTREVVEIEQGDSKSKVIVIKNITTFKELDVAKTHFIATISHELKTPLASSDFSLKLLEDERIGSLTSEQKELVQHIKQDNQRILKILSELLNMSQVEAGRIQLNTQSVSPLFIVQSAIDTVSTVASEQGIVLQQIVEPGIPDIHVDAEKTSWVLNNLLTNAIKYSPYGSEVLVQVKQQSSGVEFTVTDHGPGIPEEYQSRLFERYFQVPGSKSKGSGLGLAISKEFIEAQGGTIWVHSQLGQGSQFGFRLPAKRP